MVPCCCATQPLSTSGLSRCAAQGCAVVLVLGHPEYYPRFGFSAEVGRRIHSEYSSLGDAWMALELAPGALGEVTGSVEYPLPFRES